MKKLPPLKQEYYDENRELFNAETSVFEDKPPVSHGHDFYRKSLTEIACKHCTNGWIDPTGQMWNTIISLKK